MRFRSVWFGNTLLSCSVWFGNAHGFDPFGLEMLAFLSVFGLEMDMFYCVFALDLQIIVLTLHKLGGTRQLENNFSLRSLALTLHKLGGTYL